MIYHVNDHAAGWSDDDLKGLVRGDSLSKSLVSLCPQSDAMHPRVTFKRSILLTEGLMGLINTNRNYDPAANKPPFFRPSDKSKGKPSRSYWRFAYLL